MVKFLNKDIVIICLIVLYRLLFDYIYTRFTNPVWGYVGFDNKETNSSLLISWAVLFVLTLLVIPYFKSKESFFPELIILFFVMRVVPFTTLIRFVNTPINLTFLFFIYFALLFLLTRFVKMKQVPLGGIKGSKSDDSFLYLGLFFFSAIIIFISGYYAGFRFHLTFNDVYDLRHEASNFHIPTIIRYAWSPATNILPFLFVYFMQKKKFSVCLFIVFVILLNFSINGMKSTIFKLLICIFFSVVSFKDYKCYFIPLFIAILLITITEGFLWDSQIIHDMVIRRAFFIPALLDTYYYDYIAHNGPMFYSRTGTAIQYIIGDVYFNAPEMDCNNGLFSDAFMNLGAVGCLIYPVILAFLFRICASAFREVEKGLVVFAAMMMSYTLEGSELTTGLLTHGLFLFCVFMYLISRKNKSMRYKHKLNHRDMLIRQRSNVL